MIKGIFVDSEVGNGTLRGYLDKERPTQDELWRNAKVLQGIEKNEQILEELQKKYEIVTFDCLETAVSKMIENQGEFSGFSFIITNLPYWVFEGREEDYNAYAGAFDNLRRIRARFPKIKIIAYTAAHETVRKKVFEEGLVDAVHQRGKYGSFGSEMWHLIYGVERALEGWRKCE